MKKNEVKIGGLYRAKVSDRVVTIRIDSTHTQGGWNATNTVTGKRIRVKSAQRLRGPAEGTTGTTSTKEANTATQNAPEPPVAGKPKSRRTGGKQKRKRLSALDAAAKVLADADRPMRAQDLVAAMAEQGLWKSPGGKTPHATLYAAMTREARAKGDASRFRKVDRGMFASNQEAN